MDVTAAYGGNSWQTKKHKVIPLFPQSLTTIPPWHNLAWALNWTWGA